MLLKCLKIKVYLFWFFYKGILNLNFFIYFKIMLIFSLTFIKTNAYSLLVNYSFVYPITLQKNLLERNTKVLPGKICTDIALLKLNILFIIPHQNIISNLTRFLLLDNTFGMKRYCAIFTL